MDFSFPGFAGGEPPAHCIPIRVCQYASDQTVNSCNRHQQELVLAGSTRKTSPVVEEPAVISKKNLYLIKYYISSIIFY